MRKRRLWMAGGLIVGVAIGCFCLAVWGLQTFPVAKTLLPYKFTWDLIHVGDSRMEAERKCPDKNQKHYYGKGDNYYDVHFYGFWCMRLYYDGKDKVLAKLFYLRIGNKENYKYFNYGSEP